SLVGWLLARFIMRDFTPKNIKLHAEYILNVATQRGLARSEVGEMIFGESSLKGLLARFRKEGLIAQNDVMPPDEFKAVVTFIWKQVQQQTPNPFPASPFEKPGMISQSVRANKRTIHIIGFVHGPDVMPFMNDEVAHIVQECRQRSIPV